ncbi:MAG: hypothetical protein KKI14_00850, partial [Nanoarchaeota archaeon]|nr:hypothetical protein [Nanoarchaeota archaeon]
MEYRQIINTIKKHSSILFSNSAKTAKMQESIDVYNFIRSKYQKKELNNAFKFMFRSFYRLDNAGLSDNQKIRFFELLEKKQTDLAYILNELYKIKTRKKKNSIQFSFASKLIHTLDNDKPIWDRQATKILNLSQIKSGKKDKRINDAVNKYESLNTITCDLLKMEEIKDIIKKFRKVCQRTDGISDMKILDFI